MQGEAAEGGSSGINLSTRPCLALHCLGLRSEAALGEQRRHWHGAGAPQGNTQRERGEEGKIRGGKGRYPHCSHGLAKRTSFEFHNFFVSSNLWSRFAGQFMVISYGTESQAKRLTKKKNNNSNNNNNERTSEDLTKLTITIRNGNENKVVSHIEKHLHIHGRGGELAEGYSQLMFDLPPLNGKFK